MDRLPFVDTHVHFWDQSHPTLTYEWLAPDAVHPILGNIDGIKMSRYEAEHWWAEARFSNVAAEAVHVQAAVGTPNPVDETRWLTAMHARTGYPTAIVAHADLVAPDIDAVLDDHLESPLMRGVRDFAVEPMLASGHGLDDLARGLAAMTSRDLVLDLDCEWPNMEAAARLARRHEGLPIVLDHIGYPRSRDAEYHNAWRHGITTLATASNVTCKISGLGMNHPLWTVDSIRPWVLHCVEAFGPDRCVFGTNWPVDRLYSSYDVIVDAYRTCIEAFTPAERSSMLSENARRLFRL